MPDLGGQFGGINQQSLQQLFQNFGVNPNLQKQGPKTDEGAKDTLGKTEGDQAHEFDSGSSVISLFPPITGGHSQSGNGGFGGFKGGNGSQAVATLAGSAVAVEELENPTTLIDAIAIHNPGIKIMRQYGVEDEKILSLINNFFESEGIPAPPPPNHPKMGRAIEKSITQVLADKQVLVPDIKASVMTDAMTVLKMVQKYADYVQTIEPTETTPTLTGPEMTETTKNLVISWEEGIETAIEVLRSYGPPEVREGGLLDYLGTIAKLVTELKVILFEISMADKNMSGETLRAKLGMVDRRSDEIKEKFRQMAVAQDLKKSMDTLNKIMKVMTPVMGGGSLILSGILLLIPGMQLLALVAFLIAVIVFVVTTVLTNIEKEDQTYMAWIFSKINDQIGKAGGSIAEQVGVNWKGAEKLSKILFWVMCILMLVLMALLIAVVPQLAVVGIAVIMPILQAILANSGLADMLSSSIMAAAGQKDNEKIRMIISGLMSALLSTLATGVIQIWKMVVDAVMEILKMIFELFVAVIVLIIEIVIAVIAYLAAGYGVILTILIIVEIVIVVLQALLQILKSILLGEGGILQQIVQLVMQLVMMIAKLLLSVIKTTTTILEKILTLVKNVLLSIIKEVISLFKDIVDMIKGIVMTILELVVAMTKIMSQAVEIISNLIQAGFIKQMAAWTLLMGKLDALILILGQVIKLLDELVQKQLGQSTDFPDEIHEQMQKLSELFQRLIDNMRGITDELAGSAMA